MSVASQDWSGKLYQAVPPSTAVPITAVPYYAWDNRKAGPMKVFIPVAPRTPAAGGLESEAKVSMSFVSGNCQPRGVNDGLEPKSSGEQPAALCHFWPHAGTAEWVQYTWKSPVTVKGSKVYWFDDTGRGDLPAARVVAASVSRRRDLETDRGFRRLSGCQGWLERDFV